MSVIETSFSLLMTNVKGDEEEAKAEGQPFEFGGVMWKAVASMQRQAYINPNHTNRRRLYMWYNYRVAITCLLDEDVKYFYCKANGEHVRYWTTVQEAENMQNQLYNRPPPTNHLERTAQGHLCDRMRHEFTQDNRTMYCCVIIDPGLKDADAIEPPGKAMKIDIIFRLVDILLPVYCEPVAFGDTPWNDLEIFCEKNESLKTSKSLLASCSPYFQALFYGNFKEKSVNFVRLPDIGLNDLQELLRHLFPNCRKPITSRNVESLLHSADRFMMSCVMEECEKFLLFHKNDKTHEQPIDVQERLRLANAYRLHRLKQQCLNELDLLDEKKNILGKKSEEKTATSTEENVESTTTGEETAATSSTN